MTELRKVWNFATLLVNQKLDAAYQLRCEVASDTLPFVLSNALNIIATH